MRKNRRKLRKVTAWRHTAMSLYGLMYGRRCLVCSEPVLAGSGDLYEMHHKCGSDLLLAHRACGKKI